MFVSRALGTLRRVRPGTPALPQRSARTDSARAYGPFTIRLTRPTALSSPEQAAQLPLPVTG